MPNWEEIRREWEKSKITFKALAEKHGVKLGTLKSRRSREKWSRDATNKKDATSQKDATRKARVDATNNNDPGNEREEKESSSTGRGYKKSRYKEGSRKGAGNPHPGNQFTKRNSAALKHGFFSKHIPQETLDIMQGMVHDDPADLIYDQIMIQYAAIIRAQNIMFVTDRNETVKELKKLKVEEGFDREGNVVQVPVEQEYEIQFAWDRYATFMNAQSRAMSEFRSLVKQFFEMTHEDDERRLKLEQMQLGIEKTQAELDLLENEDGEDAPIEILIKRKGDDE